MGSIASRRFYVYILCRPNGKPFYVGKGTGDRINDHDGEARSGHRCHKCNIIRKIWRQGGQIQRYILLETDDEHEALAYEVEVIALHGRNNLANLTDGGEGFAGGKFSPEAHAKLSAAQKRAWANPERRRKQSESAKAQLASPEARAAHSARLKKKNTADDARRIRWAQPGAHERASEVMRKIGSDPEHRKKLSEAQKRRYAQPGVRERQLQLLQKIWNKRRALAQLPDQETP